MTFTLNQEYYICFSYYIIVTYELIKETKRYDHCVKLYRPSSAMTTVFCFLYIAHMIKFNNDQDNDFICCLKHSIDARRSFLNLRNKNAKFSQAAFQLYLSI